MDDPPSLWQATVLGLVEGITEFLPVSSTGHLIVAGRAIGYESPPFEVAIQMGAITAILLLYRRPLWQATRQLAGRAPDGTRPRHNLWLLLLVAALPAAVLGLALEATIEAWLFSPGVVATALVLGGVALLLLERWYARRATAPSTDVTDMGYRQALIVGICQCLALIPGTSRSAATIGGGLVAGMDRPAAAEFSFLVGVPILYGACLLQLVDDTGALTGPALPAFLLATAVSFASALVVVVPFVAFLRRHTFRVFAWYRIAAGLAIGGLVAAGWL